MKTVIEMAREAGWDDHHAEFDTRIERFAELVRADALADQTAQRTWVGLTDDERFKVAEQTGCMSSDWLDVVKATETALQIKNQ